MSSSASHGQVNTTSALQIYAGFRVCLSPGRTLTTLHGAAEKSNSMQYRSDITTGKLDAHKLGTFDGQNRYQETQICQSQNMAGNAKSELHLH